MAENHAFDVVSEISHAEMHNAVVQAQHELAVRFDFKGTHASIEFNKKENTLTILADLHHPEAFEVRAKLESLSPVAL